MYDNLIAYRPFHTLISKCRGNAVSLAERAAEAFPDVGEEEALNYVSILPVSYTHLDVYKRQILNESTTIFRKRFFLQEICLFSVC